jgi:hypothetical protein
MSRTRLERHADGTPETTLATRRMRALIGVSSNVSSLEPFRSQPPCALSTDTTAAPQLPPSPVTSQMRALPQELKDTCPATSK